LIPASPNRKSERLRKQGVGGRHSRVAAPISLLAEQEITKIVQIVSQIAERMGIEAVRPEVEEMMREIAPEAVLDAIEESKRQAETTPGA
jgi:hypothetical protein